MLGSQRGAATAGLYRPTLCQSVGNMHRKSGYTRTDSAGRCSSSTPTCGWMQMHWLCATPRCASRCSSACLSPAAAAPPRRPTSACGRCTAHGPACAMLASWAGSAHLAELQGLEPALALVSPLRLRRASFPISHLRIDQPNSIRLYRASSRPWRWSAWLASG